MADPPPAGLLPVAAARARVLEGLGPLAAEWVPLEAGLDRVLAEDLRALRTSPPRAVSAMDGYAVRAGDAAGPGPVWRVAGENRAGATAVARLGPGEAVRVFTGAHLPEGADAVGIEENATPEPGGGAVRFSRAPAPGEFVRPAGLDFERGWTGLAAGTRLGPRALGLAAAMGHASLPVRRRPRVAILSTGDEIVRPGAMAGPDQVVSSNAVTLAALVRRWGGEPTDLGVAGDTRQALLDRLRGASGADLLLTSGGASVGAYDLVRPALLEGGLRLEFWRLAMRPGKPMLFGRLGATPVLGLPGNAVSATVCALLFARPAVMALLGRPAALEPVPARLAGPLAANDHREDYLRARLARRDPDGTPWLEAVRRQDSSMFAALAGADALVVRASHAPAAEAGDSVPALFLDAAEGAG